MRGTKRLCVSAAILVCLGMPARAQHHGIHTASWHSGTAHGGAAQRMGAGGSQGALVFGSGFGGWYPYYSPIILVGPGAFFSPFAIMNNPPQVWQGPLLPPPPPGWMAPAANPARQPADPTRAGQLMTRGDRLFRAGNYKKAEERYLQAARAAPDLAGPHLRLAQVAIVRGNYSDAVLKLREAETAQPGWIITAPDIESIFGEPAEFARHVAKLESYIQSHPDDRDAWLALGAEWFLSGRTAKAADVFKRLDDPRRKPDTALAAFLDASNQADRKAAAPLE